MIRYKKRKHDLRQTINVNGNVVPISEKNVRGFSNGKPKKKFSLWANGNKKDWFLSLLLGMLVVSTLTFFVMLSTMVIRSLGWKTLLFVVGGVIVLYIMYRVGAYIANKFNL